MTAQVAADLRAAAEVLRRDGWTQEEYVSGRGACCAVGGLMKVVDPGAGPNTDLSDLPKGDYERLGEAAKVLITSVSPDDLKRLLFWDAPITRWNDAPGRTADEVIAALEAAADAAEADQ